MAIQVIAKQVGYYDNKLIPEGMAFDLDEKFCKKDASGKSVLPKWVSIAEEIVETKVVAKDSGMSKKSKDAVI